ncbi:MAG: sugar phosphate nucleotidyltransferase [Patescibacteria group bacterium]|nr:MAG: sugar phosphate nucleotidyltransferase [Patescibacteria group bacterium]
MKAVIFAAGLGTRLRPLTDTIPKPMIEIGGKPILQHTIEALPETVSEIVIVVGYLSQAICMRFENTARVRCVDQTDLRGTYDALLRAKPFLDAEPFLALNGDDLYAREDLERLAAAKPFAMLAHRVPAPNPYSHLESADGFLKKIVPNKDVVGLEAHEVYVGACLLDARFFDLEPAALPNGEFGLPQTLAKHLDKNPVQLIESKFWMPVGTPDELEAARRATRVD